MKNYFGFYRGIVKDNDDSSTTYPYRGRIKVHVPQVHGEEFIIPDQLPWAEPCFPLLGGGKPEVLEEGEEQGEGSKYGHGVVALPPVGSTVWVGFEHGHPNRPIWFGTWYGTRDESIEMPSSARSDGRSGTYYPNLITLQAPGPPAALVDPLPPEDPDDPPEKPERHEGLYLRFVGKDRIEIVFHQGKNYIELDGVNRKVLVNTEGWDIDLTTTAVNSGDSASPTRQGGNINIRANKLTIPPEEEGGESVDLGGDVLIMGKNVTIQADEDVSIFADETAMLRGAEKGIVSSNRVIYGMARSAGGFDAH